MAWRSHGEDNDSLVQNLFNNHIIKSEEVRDVMKQVDRGNYVKHNAYMDAPQRIGYNITISAPHMHGHALELLQNHLKPGMRALDVGSGSGYLTVCMALMVGKTGKTVGIDHIPELVEMGRDQSLDQVERSMDGKVTKTRLFGVRYVPLTDKDKQLRMYT